MGSQWYINSPLKISCCLFVCIYMCRLYIKFTYLLVGENRLFHYLLSGICSFEQVNSWAIGELNGLVVGGIVYFIIVDRGEYVPRSQSGNVSISFSSSTQNRFAVQGNYIFIILYKVDNSIVGMGVGVI